MTVMLVLWMTGNKEYKDGVASIGVIFIPNFI